MIKYRPDIDGLRAISIISVLIYHGNFEFFGYNVFKGGFLGVDIFFVISGYLISSIIFQEYHLYNKFNFKNFYNRRIRRIIPVLLFITLLTIPFSYYYLLPNKLIEFSNSIFFSTFFISNIYFIYDSLQYGGDQSILKPFLHTWSLSVEEQFYLIFPLMMIFILRFFNKFLLIILFAILILSLSFAEWGSVNNQLNNFYLLTSRIWEIFFGVIISLLHHKNFMIIKNKYFINFLTIVSLLIIFISLTIFGNELQHPSLFTLLPVLATSLIIYFNTEHTVVGKFLSLNFLVYIGLISYSLYLWHFPILSFMFLMGLDDNFFSFLGLFISFPFSILTYKFIETRFRDKKKINNKTCYLLIFISITSIILFVFLSHKTEGFKNRSNILFKKDLSEKPWEILKNSNDEICHLKIKEFCKFISKDSTQNIFLLGDSHMITLGKSLYEYTNENNINLITMTNGGCYFFPDFDYIDLKTKEVAFGCNKQYQQLRINHILENKNSIIIIGGNINRYLSNKNLNGEPSEFIFANSNFTFLRSFQKNLAKILQNNKVILVYPIPEIPFYPLTEIYNRSGSLNYDNLRKYIENNNTTTNLKNYFSRSQKSFEFLDSFNDPNLYRVYPHKTLCDNLECFVSNKDELFYFDSEHLSVSGASKLTDLIIKKIEQIKF
jgi:peptidoglycan/LPS O-acetylase OafA/YrhL